MELRAILVVLYSHSLIYTSAFGIFIVTAAILCRPSDVAVLLNYSLNIDIHDRHADRCDDHATCDREESMYSQRRGKERDECTPVVFLVDLFKLVYFIMRFFFFTFIYIHTYVITR